LLFQLLFGAVRRLRNRIGIERRAMENVFNDHGAKGDQRPLSVLVASTVNNPLCNLRSRTLSHMPANRCCRSKASPTTIDRHQLMSGCIPNSFAPSSGTLLGGGINIRPPPVLTSHAEKHLSR